MDRSRPQLKFTAAGGSVDVKISCELMSSTNANNIVSRAGVDAVGLLRVEVTDSGAGIAPEDQHKVFGEFTQFDRNRLQGGGGSGLGLWISRRIIHLHKGSMGFTSAGHGKGATFFFELPLYSSSSASLAQEDHVELAPSLSEPPEVPLEQSLSSYRRRQSLDGRAAVIESEKSQRKFEFDQICLLKTTAEDDVLDGKDDDSSDASKDVVEDQTDLKRPSLYIAGKNPPLSEATSSAQSPTSKGFNRSNKKNLVVKTEAALPSAESELDEVMVTPVKAKPNVFDEGSDTHRGAKVHPVPSPSSLTAVSVPPNNPYRFLIVDDSALNRKMIMRLIQSEKSGRFRDALLQEADDGSTAIDALQSALEMGETYDFILMDYTMLKVHGPDAVAIMRKDLKYHRPIIGVTGNVLPKDIAKFISSGVNKVLTKPLTKSKLMDTLASFQ